MSKSKTNPSEAKHSIDLEVSGSEISLLKMLLDEVQLSDGIQRVSIQIDSDSPLTNPLRDESGASDEESDDVSDDAHDDTDSTDDAHDDESDEESDDESEEHVTDELTAGHEESENAKEYVEELDSEDDDSPDPDDMISGHLEPDTGKWHVTALLYRSDGRLTGGQIENMLEGTAWDISRSSVYTAVSNLAEMGLIDKEKRGAKTAYQLTQLGRDYMQAKAPTTEGYKFRPADRATGKNPQNKPATSD